MIVVDTGPIVAAMNDRDQRHPECADLFRKGRGPFFVPFMATAGEPDDELGLVPLAYEGDLRPRSRFRASSAYPTKSTSGVAAANVSVEGAPQTP